MMWGTNTQKIRIFSKKLNSGNCQVKFYINSEKGKPYYGYLLVRSGQKVSDVITSIYHKLEQIDDLDNYYHRHLYQMGRNPNYEPSFLIFRGDQ